MKQLGNKIDNIEDLLGLFEPDEGKVAMYYGRIGSGKTYSAVADILEELEKGQVIYCNWHINWDGFDERTSFWHLLFSIFFFRSRFYKFPKTNLHYFNIENYDEVCNCGKIHNLDIDFLSSLTDCQVFIDEGQWIFDSRSRLDKNWRKLILHTRHMNRGLNIVSQRTNAIEVTARGQVNVFYKCEKRFTWPWLIFRRTEYQDMKNDDVDDGETAEPTSVKTYFARRKVMNAYDTHYLRTQAESSQELNFEAYKLNWADRILGLILKMVGYKWWQEKAVQVADMDIPIPEKSVRRIPVISEEEKGAIYNEEPMLVSTWEDEED